MFLPSARVTRKRVSMIRRAGTPLIFRISLPRERSAAEAFLFMYILESACRIQILAQSGGKELVKIPGPILEGIAAQVEMVTKGLGGDLVFPALLRKLDRTDESYKT